MDRHEVQDALARMKAGEASDEIFDVLVAAAEAYAAMEPEWGFESPQTGLMYVTKNDMLIETMRAARPEAVLLSRVAPPWAALTTKEN